MSKAAQFVGKVAGVVAFAASVALTGGATAVLGASLTSIAAGAGAIVAASSAIAQATASKPPVRGSVTDITIGADQPTPYMIGDTYAGGALVHRTGYGARVDKVDNPLLAMAVVYSAGGPIAGIDQYLADFEPLSVNGAGAAAGYFAGYLYVRSTIGPLLQSTALTGAFGAIPGWDAASRLSSKAHALWSLKWDAKNGKYQAGAPQLGIRGRGVLTWDPRKDSTWTGGSGAQRWASPKDRAGFDAARATWAYTDRPGLHALRYALGTWERDLSNATSDYVLTFGIGMPIDGIVVDDFVALENVCEANGWTVSGVLYEPGDTMANLKRILEAGGAEPCWKGGRLGLRIRAPRIALDTITRADLDDGELRAAAHQGWERRINAVIPKYRSPTHKWTMQGAAKKVVADYVASDGEEKPREVPFECVTDADQAAELALYELYDSREQGPITLPVKARLRRYMAGDRLALSPEVRADLGLLIGDVVVIDRAFDAGRMSGTLTVVTDNPNKHAAALGSTGVAPPAIAIPTTAQFDGAQAVAAAFVHFAYAASADGTVDFSLTPSTGRGWLGTYSDNDPIASTDPAKYAWALVRGPKGDTGPPGASSYALLLSNESHTVPADEAGNVTSYAGASTDVRVLYGTQDVTSLFSFDYPSNPQGLSTNESAFPTIVVTGGLDAGEDSAALTIRMTGTGAHAGMSLSRVFSLSKSRAGANGEPPPLITLSADKMFAKYDGTDTYIGGAIRFTAIRQNIPGPNTFFRIIRVSDGSVLSADTSDAFGAGYGGSYAGSGGDKLVMTAGAVASTINAYGTFRVEAYRDGYAVTDSVPIAKVKDGANGADAIVGALTTTIWTVKAGSDGVTKLGQLNQYSALKVKRGATDITGDCAVALTPSDSGQITASYSGGSIVLSKADAAGYVDVTVTYAGAPVAGSPFRIQIYRPTDAPPPQGSTSQTGQVYTAPGSTSYAGATDQTVVLKANGAGAVNFSAALQYVPEQPSNQSTRSYTAAASPVWRAPGGSWSYAGETVGSFATNRGGFEPEANEGALSIAGASITGLTAGALYEFGLAVRRSAGNSPVTALYGSFTVSQ